MNHLYHSCGPNIPCVCGVQATDHCVRCGQLSCGPNCAAFRSQGDHCRRPGAHNLPYFTDSESNPKHHSSCQPSTEGTND